MKTLSMSAGALRAWQLAILAAAASSVPALGDPATGVFTDRNATLRELDAQNVLDGSGAHFAGSRATSVLDAGVSTYYYNNGGRFDYWATLPGVPHIEVGANSQTVSQNYPGSGISSAASYPVPTAGGGTVNVSVSYIGETHATASLAQGTLRASASALVSGPGVGFVPAAPYDGFGAYGSAYARAELADYLATSADTTLHLSGIWDGHLSSGAAASGVIGGSSPLDHPIVEQPNPASAVAHMEISIWSAPHSVFHPGDEESPGSFTQERTYLGGVTLDRNVTYGDPDQNIHEAFDVSVAVPAGNFYFYASQWVSTGGQSDPSKGFGNAVTLDTLSTADFDHTLSFNLQPNNGATLSSESGQFLASPVPEPEEWAAAVGVALAGWAVWRRRK